MVYFVGAGTGAADLITVRGMRLLQKADVIIYAGSLVNPELLDYARESCEIYNSAKMTLDEVIAVMKAAEADGKMTVRLHTGEPSIYGAVREQMDELDTLLIPYESCPGVSACFGAAASLNIEYTLPGISQSLIITRMEGRTKVPPKESIASFASHHASVSFSKPPHQFSHIFQSQNNSLFQFRSSDVGTTFFIIHRLFSPSACVDDPLLLFHFAGYRVGRYISPAVYS